MAITQQGNPYLQAWYKKFQAAHNTVSDHNGVKGYTRRHIPEASIDNAGRFDRKAAAAAVGNSCFSAKHHPGVLVDVCFDDQGDIDRESFMTEVRGGKAVVVVVVVVAETLPALNKE